MLIDDVSFEYCDDCVGIWLDISCLDSSDSPVSTRDESTGAVPTNGIAAELANVASLLVERQNRFQAFFDNVPLEVGIKDTQGRYLLINKHTEEIYGRSNDEVRGKFPQDVFDEGDSELMLAAQEKALTTGEMATTEVRDNEGRWYLATYFPIRDGRGRITSLGSMGIDVSSRREAELKLERLNEELESKVEQRTNALREAQEELLKQTRLAMVGQLTATVSHELRNPMATMRTSVFLINELIDHGNEKVERALGRLERSLQRCDNIIDELLDFARTKEAVLEPLDLDNWLSRLLDEYEPDENVEIEIRLDAVDVNVAADRERLRRAVINVVENACHALLKQRPTDDPHPDPRVTASTRLMEDRAIIEIVDNGVGMDEATLQNCFEPLFSTKGFGTGLGLPAAKQILEQHNGGIDISSEPGAGTTVSLWLPYLVQV